MEAEGAAIQHHRRTQRHPNLLLAAGVPPERIEAAKAVDRWRPLLERMRVAERLGLDLRTALDSLGRRPEDASGALLTHLDAGLAAWIARAGPARTWQEANRPGLIREGLDASRTL